ncbi:MAG: hypothetical protein ACFFD8_06650 [Candidatus Thorarchaeota archaeon]
MTRLNGTIRTVLILSTYIAASVLFPIPLFTGGFPFTNAQQLPTEVANDQQWSQFLIGGGPSLAYSVIECMTGGFVFTGHIIDEDAGLEDVWLAKTDENGNLEWNHSYPDSDRKWGYSLIECRSGGYAIVGCVLGIYSDIILLRTDANGNLLWEMTFDFGEQEEAFAITELASGNLIICGYVHHYRPTNPIDGLVFCTDENGTLLWQREYGGLYVDRFYSMASLIDGHFLFAGISFETGLGDMWLVKTDSQGVLEWSHTYGGMEYDRCNGVVVSHEGSYTLAGVTENSTTYRMDALLIRTNSYGVELWNRTIGSDLDENARAITTCSNGGYAITGEVSQSINEPWFNLMVMRFDENGQLMWEKHYGGEGNDVGWAVIECADGDLVIAGLTSSFGLDGGTAWMLRIPNAAPPDSNPHVIDLNIIALGVFCAILILSVSVGLFFRSRQALKNQIKECV